jgi:predicted metal-dependent phosphoesterase TrpH
MRIDLHIHTCYSYDSNLTLDQLSTAVRCKGLDGIAVLDHDEIEGALTLRENAPFEVIVGEEIGSAHGGIGALFIERRIPPHLGAEETIARIRDQGGLVFIPHPFSRAVPGRIDQQKLYQIISQIDIIEGYNARAPRPTDDQRARDLALQHGLPIAAGSDAHFSWEVGRAYTEMDSFKGPAQFMDSLHNARLYFKGKTPFIFPLLTVAVMIPYLGAKRSLFVLLRNLSRHHDRPADPPPRDRR